MNDIFHEEYRIRYDELFNLITRAYINIYVLKETESFSKSMQERKDVLLFKSTKNIIEHMSELLKTDLGLTIWKIYSDENNKANTIKHLNTYIRKYLQDQDGTTTIKSLKIKPPEEIRDIEKRLCILRRNFLAHNDKEKQDVSVEVTEMERFLDFLRETLNKLCFSELDERVEKMTKQKLLSIQQSSSFGWGNMIRRSVLQAPQGEDPT